MTYYEELGVPASATLEQIRQAYRRRAQPHLADLQRKRLDGILEVLQEPAARERYDRSLAAFALAVSGKPPPSARRRWDGRWAPASIGAAACLLILLVALWPSKPPAPRAPLPWNWEEHLAAYPHESRVPIPPLPFPEMEPLPEGCATRTTACGGSR